MGAGHHGAADELVRRLRSGGHVAERIDVLDLGRPGEGEQLRTTYAFLLAWLPWAYDLAMRFWARWPTPLERLTAHGAGEVERSLLARVDDFRPDVVVSVYNLSSQALGRLRAAGRLQVPVVTYVTDPGAHPYWVHPAVDLHLTVLPTTAAGLRAMGAGRTAVVAPLVAEAFGDAAPPRAEARRLLGLPVNAPVALVSAGSWGAGHIEATVRALARSGIVPLTMCGQNRNLRERLDRRVKGVAVGWTNDVALLMAAADVFVDNAGGLTCWEALVTGLPVVVFRPLPGHGRFNARALEEAGCASWARTRRELAAIASAACGSRSALRGEASAGSRPSAIVGGDPASAVLDLCGAAAQWQAA